MGGEGKGWDGTGVQTGCTSGTHGVGGRRARADTIELGERVHGLGNGHRAGETVLDDTGTSLCAHGHAHVASEVGGCRLGRATALLVRLGNDASDGRGNDGTDQRRMQNLLDFSRNAVVTPIRRSTLCHDR